ncbi:MAG: FtsW/RodA/SpoVE family cell cycle protein, partial [Bowdeniella nasicola]|nr:FtsW/RodA/SpoVE family cell cycle protein [Bowdeniella nasicola]
MSQVGNRVRTTIDKPVSFAVILASSAVLLVIGIAMVTSASSITSYREYTTPFFDAKRQILFAIVGLLGAALCARVPISLLQRFTPLIFLFSLALGALVFTNLVASKGGNSAWVYIPGLNQSIQPSEFLKIAVVLYLALLLSKHRDHLTDRHVLLTIGGVCLAAVVVVMGGHDLGTALIMGAMIYVMLWQGGLPRPLLILAAALAVIYIGYEVISNPTRLQRILAFLPGYELDPA